MFVLFVCSHGISMLFLMALWLSGFLALWLYGSLALWLSGSMAIVDGTIEVTDDADTCIYVLQLN